MVLMIALDPGRLRPPASTECRRFSPPLLRPPDHGPAVQSGTAASASGSTGALWLVPVIVGLYLVFPLMAGEMFLKMPWAALVGSRRRDRRLEAGLRATSRGSSSRSRATRPRGENLKIIALDQTPAYVFSFTLGMGAARSSSWPGRTRQPWIRRGVIVRVRGRTPGLPPALDPVHRLGPPGPRRDRRQHRGRGLVLRRHGRDDRSGRC